MKFQIIHENQIRDIKLKRHHAYITSIDINRRQRDISPYIIVEPTNIGNKGWKDYLKYEDLESVGNLLYIAKDVLQKVSDQSEVEVRKATTLQFHWHVMMTDKGNRVLLGILILALVGLIITSGFAIGEKINTPLISLSTRWIVILKTIAIIFQAMGLILAFIKELAKNT